jgi:nucleoside-triphosphatase
MMNVFDVCGNKILLNSGRHDIIVMDEIGFLESASVSFQQSVMRHISGNVPILGVIKPMRTEFLDTIRAHPNVEIREVTAENRDDVLTWVLGQMNAKCRKGETADEYI